MDTSVRQSTLKKELRVLVLFGAPWLTSTSSGLLLVIIQQLPSSYTGPWLFAFSESTRYAFCFEPILTFILLKQIRQILRKKLFIIIKIIH